MKADLREMEGRLEKQIGTTNKNMQAQFWEVRKEIGEVKKELKSEIVEVKRDVAKLGLSTRP